MEKTKDYLALISRLEVINKSDQWRLDFFRSCKKRLLEGRELSPKQEEHLLKLKQCGNKRIWSKFGANRLHPDEYDDFDIDEHGFWDASEAPF